MLFIPVEAKRGLDHNFGHFVLIFSEPEKYRWSYKWLIVP